MAPHRIVVEATGPVRHVHLSGASYAEPMIGWAAREGLCVRLKDWFIVVPPCTPDEPPVAETMRDQRKFDAMVNAMSMRFFLPTPAVPSGHDQRMPVEPGVASVCTR